MTKVISGCLESTFGGVSGRERDHSPTKQTVGDTRFNEVSVFLDQYLLFTYYYCLFVMTVLTIIVC